MASVIRFEREPTEFERLQDLAATIPDLAAFDALMLQVNPLMREEVRRLLSTMVSFEVPDAPIATH